MKNIQICDKLATVNVVTLSSKLFVFKYQLFLIFSFLFNTELFAQLKWMKQIIPKPVLILKTIQALPPMSLLLHKKVRNSSIVLPVGKLDFLIIMIPSMFYTENYI